ncbi:unnamed protein product, partial [Mesorhabditis spiculigera]
MTTTAGKPRPIRRGRVYLSEEQRLCMNGELVHTTKGLKRRSQVRPADLLDDTVFSDTTMAARKSLGAVSTKSAVEDKENTFETSALDADEIRRIRQENARRWAEEEQNLGGPFNIFRDKMPAGPERIAKDESGSEWSSDNETAAEEAMKDETAITDGERTPRAQKLPDEGIEVTPIAKVAASQQPSQSTPKSHRPPELLDMDFSKIEADGNYSRFYVSQNSIDFRRSRASVSIRVRSEQQGIEEEEPMEVDTTAYHQKSMGQKQLQQEQEVVEAPEENKPSVVISQQPRLTSNPLRPSFNIRKTLDPKIHNRKTFAPPAIVIPPPRALAQIEAPLSPSPIAISPTPLRKPVTPAVQKQAQHHGEPMSPSSGSDSGLPNVRLQNTPGRAPRQEVFERLATPKHRVCHRDHERTNSAESPVVAVRQSTPKANKNVRSLFHAVLQKTVKRAKARLPVPGPSGIAAVPLPKVVKAELKPIEAAVPLAKDEARSSTSRPSTSSSTDEAIQHSRRLSSIGAASHRSSMAGGFDDLDDSEEDKPMYVPPRRAARVEDLDTTSEEPGTPDANATYVPCSLTARRAPRPTKQAPETLVVVPPKIVYAAEAEGATGRPRRNRVPPLRRWLGEEAIYEASPGGKNRQLVGVKEAVIRQKDLVKNMAADAGQAMANRDRARVLRKNAGARRARIESDDED